MLRTGDVLAIAAAQRPAWLRHVPGLLLLLAVGVLAALHSTLDPVLVCTDADPCGPTPFGAVSTGLALAVPFAAFASVRTAAGLAGGFLATDVVGQVAAPQELRLWAVDAGYVALAVALTVLFGRRRRGRVEATWAAAAQHRVPPVPREQAQQQDQDQQPHRQRHGRGMWVVAVLLFVLAAGIAGWSLVAQARGQAQEETARLVAGEVVGHPDEFTVEVRLAGGDVVRIEVIDARTHPVGARRGVRADDAGLRQLVAEPYDTTGWLILAVMAAGLGLALRARSREPGAALRALFTHEQPVSQVYLRLGQAQWQGAGPVAVYAADARPGEPPILQYTTSITEHEDEDEDEIRPAVLYGIPAAGQWCVAEVDGRILVPLDTARVPVDAPGFTRPADDEEQPDPATLPPRPEEVAALRPEDRDADPDLIRTHRRGPAAGYGFALALPLVLLSADPLLPDWPLPVWLAVLAPLAALGCFGGWRMYLRPHLVWNGAGISAVGVTGARLLAWNNIDTVRADGDGTVRVETLYRTFLVTAHRGGPVSRLTGRGERSATQLSTALRLAKHRAEQRERSGERDVTTLPPAPGTPHPPAALWVLGLLEVLLYAWLLSQR